MPNVWVYPHQAIHAGELGIVHFRMSLEARMRGEPYWDREWGTNSDRAKAGDTVVFSFKEGDEWYAVGDAVVFRVDDAEADDDWKFKPRYECFRLYPRNVPYGELRLSLSAFNPDQYQFAKLSPEDYLRLLELTVKPRE